MNRKITVAGLALAALTITACRADVTVDEGGVIQSTRAGLHVDVAMSSELILGDDLNAAVDRCETGYGGTFEQTDDGGFVCRDVTTVPGD